MFASEKSAKGRGRFFAGRQMFSSCGSKVDNEITQFYLLLTFHIREGKARPGYSRPQSSVAVTLYIMVAPHFTYPEKVES